MKKAWSDQLPGVVVNGLPNKPTGTPGFGGFGTGWTEKPYIFMGVRGDGKAYVKAEVGTMPPESMRDKIQWRLAKRNGPSGHGAPEAGSSSWDAATNTVSVVLDNPTSDDVDYVLVWGFDQNGDGNLTSIVMPTCENKLPKSLGGTVVSQPFVFKVVSKSRFADSVGSVNALAGKWVTFPLNMKHASTLLSAFASAEKPTYDNPTEANETLTRLGVDQDGVRLGLSHPVGILFTPGTDAGTTKRFSYSSESEIVQKFLYSKTFLNAFYGFLQSKKAEIQKRFRDDPDLVEDDWEWDWNGDVDFGDTANRLQDVEMALAMGHGKFSVTVDAKIHRADLTVVNIGVRSGRAFDLYDFDYDGDILFTKYVSQAAAVEAGYNTAGSGGRVVTWEIKMEDEVITLPADVSWKLGWE